MKSHKCKILRTDQLIGRHVVVVLGVVGDVRLGRVRGVLLLSYSCVLPVGGAFWSRAENFNRVLNAALDVNLWNSIKA